jgi:hypothetical protein
VDRGQHPERRPVRRSLLPYPNFCWLISRSRKPRFRKAWGEALGIGRPIGHALKVRLNLALMPGYRLPQDAGCTFSADPRFIAVLGLRPHKR